MPAITAAAGLNTQLIGRRNPSPAIARRTWNRSSRSFSRRTHGRPYAGIASGLRTKMLGSGCRIGASAAASFLRARPMSRLQTLGVR